MTVIDITTTEGQRHLLGEVKRRKLRLQRDPDGTYRLEQWLYGSITRERSSGGKRVTPFHHWKTIAEFPSLSTLAAAITDFGETPTDPRQWGVPT
jgi:hypothetical protein